MNAFAGADNVKKVFAATQIHGNDITGMTLSQESGEYVLSLWADYGNGDSDSCIFSFDENLTHVFVTMESVEGGEPYTMEMRFTAIGDLNLDVTAPVIA